MPEIAPVPAADTGDDALFRDPSVDAVWIGPPNPLHAPRAIAATYAHKHVSVEKPMALTLDDATRCSRRQPWKDGDRSRTMVRGVAHRWKQRWP